MGENIYTKSIDNFVPGMPLMAYQTPIPVFTPKKVSKESVIDQFPKESSSVTCGEFSSVGWRTPELCSKSAKIGCPLGRKAQPVRNISPGRPTGPKQLKRIVDDVPQINMVYCSYKTFLLIIILLICIKYAIRKN